MFQNGLFDTEIRLAELSDVYGGVKVQRVAAQKCGTC